MIAVDSRLAVRNIAIASLALAALAAASIASNRTAARPVPYPEGFRQWAHVKSALVWPDTPTTEAFSGLHNIYANEAALRGYRDGTFPQGSVIVFDLFAVEATKTGFEPTRRKALDVMVREQAGTAGWRFERFFAGKPADRASAQTKERCLACHSRDGGGDMVFSRIVD